MAFRNAAGFGSPLRPRGDFVFEVSWEVCNKVGGIYTVVSSKAARMIEWYGAGYCLIGPYTARAVGEGFEARKAPRWLEPLLVPLEARGISLHAGVWNVKGHPSVILVNFDRYSGELNSVKARLWEWHRIDSLGSGRDYDEPLLWAWATGLTLRLVAEARSREHGVFHFHEWLSGAALLYLRHAEVRGGLVFTTHATVLGRALANRGVDIYRERMRIHVDEAAYEAGVHSMHQLEQATAAGADVFTTVSMMTAEEAKTFLGRVPDFILPNGLDIVTFPRIRTATRLHEFEKRGLVDFLRYYFFPYTWFPEEEVLLYFIASRYEFHDKGIDLFIRALGTLNDRLRTEKRKRTIVAFFWVPTSTGGVRSDVLELRDRYFRLVADFKKDGFDIRDERTFRRFFAEPGERDLRRLSFSSIKELRGFRRSGTPPLTTHDLMVSSSAILEGFRSAGLLNRARDHVKVVWYPVYLSPRDGLLNLGYHESMQGAHLGVFPSFYEPWGYTPLESAALGIPAITTDLAGFGRYLEDSRASRGDGIYLLRRSGRTDEEAGQELAELLYRFSSLTHGGRRRSAGAARRIAELADWKYFVRHYVRAHNAAIAQSKGQAAV